MRTGDFDLNADSRFIAFTPGDDGGGLRIQRFPEGGARTTVTTMDAKGINWSHDDTRLYFWAEDSFWEALVDVSGQQPIVSPPRKLFDNAEKHIVSNRLFGVGSDGRFLMIRNPADMLPAPESITVNVGLGWMKDNAMD